MTTTAIRFARITTGAIVIALFGHAAGAVELDCSGTKKSRTAPFRESVRPGDRPDHEIVLAVRTHAIRSNAPELDGAEQTAFALQDEYGFAGTQTGYFMYSLAEGNKIWAKFDSVDSRSGTSPNWEVTYQGVFRFISGTGKFSAIRGGGHYQGRVRPDSGFDESFVCRMEY